MNRFILIFLCTFSCMASGGDSLYLDYNKDTDCLYIKEMTVQGSIHYSQICVVPLEGADINEIRDMVKERGDYRFLAPHITQFLRIDSTNSDFFKVWVSISALETSLTYPAEGLYTSEDLTELIDIFDQFLPGRSLCRGYTSFDALRIGIYEIMHTRVDSLLDAPFVYSIYDQIIDMFWHKIQNENDEDQVKESEYFNTLNEDYLLEEEEAIR